MAVLELIKHADYSKHPPGSPRPPEGWPLSHVEIVGDPPDKHVFGDGFVAQAVRDGWMRFDGKPLTYTVQPDPMRSDAGLLTEQTVKLEGTRLVLSVERNGKETEIVYEITRGPVPRGFRIEDKSSPTGFAAPHEYACSLVKRKGAK